MAINTATRHDHGVANRPCNCVFSHAWYFTGKSGCSFKYSRISAMGNSADSAVSLSNRLLNLASSAKARGVSENCGIASVFVSNDGLI